MADAPRPWNKRWSGVAAWVPKLAASPKAAQSVLRILLSWAGVAAIGSWLGFYFIALTPGLKSETFDATIQLHVITSAVLIPYLGYTFLRGRLPGGSPLDWPIAFVMAAYAVTTAASLAWRVSLEFTLLALMAVAIFVVLSDSRLFQRWQVEAGLMLGAAAAAGYGLWIAGNDYADWLRLTHSVRGRLFWSDLIPPTVPRIHGVSDFVTILGMVLGITFPFYLGAWLRGGVARLFGALGALVVLLALFLTLARGAWLGAALGSAVTLAGFWLMQRRSRVRLDPAGAVARRPLVLGAALAGGLVAVAVLVTLVASWDTRPDWLFRPSLEPRQEALSEGAAYIREHPLLGTGPAAYGLMYNAHNGYVQAVVDMGALGALAGLALAATIVWLLARSIGRAAPSTQATLLAAAGGFTALAVHSLVDTPNLWKSSLAAMAALAAVAVQGWWEAERQEPAVRPQRAPTLVVRQAPRVLLALALVGLPLAWGWLDLAHYHYNRGILLANDESWRPALREVREAARLDPDLAIYQLELGLLEVRAYEAIGDPALLESGIAHLRRGTDLEPRGGLGFANLAIAASLAGDRQGAHEWALEAIDRADALLRDDPSVVLAAATVLEENGFRDEALSAYSSALSMDPRLADSPFWSGSELRRTAFGQIVSGSLLVFNPCLMLELHLRSENQALKASLTPVDDAFSRCALRVSAKPDEPGSRVILAEALLARGDLEGAFFQLRTALDRQPDHGPAHTALGRWYAAQNNLAEARAEWLKAGQLKQPNALILLGDSYPPGQVPPEVISRLQAQLPLLATEVQNQGLAILYYRMMFGRASPWLMLLPGAWQEAVPGQYAQAQEALARWQGLEQQSLSRPEATE